MIWTYSLEPQTFHVAQFNHFWVEGPFTAPAILHVNTESRAIALKSYNLMPVPTNRMPPFFYIQQVDIGFIYFNPALDVFSLGYKLFYDQFDYHERWLDEWFEALKRKPGFRGQVAYAPEDFWKIIEEERPGMNSDEIFEIITAMLEGMEVVSESNRTLQPPRSLV